MENKIFHSFLSANSADGFVSYFSELQNPESQRLLYVIKGGPGTGKSTLMRHIGTEAEKRGIACEYIHCSSDPKSLDGLFLGNGNIAVADGTPPHTIEPAYPGAFERVINLNALFDNQTLFDNKTEIIALSKQNREAHRQTVAFLSAAGALKQDSIRLAEQGLLSEKLMRCARRFALPKAGKPGRCHKRFLTACSGNGIVFFEGTLTGCDAVYAIDDRIGAASSVLLEQLRKQYQNAGYDTYAFYCPLAPTERIEHLMIPDCALCFTTRNKFHAIPKELITRTLHTDRFYNIELLRRIRVRLHFNERAIRELIGAACEQEAMALENHNQLEQCYTPSVRFAENQAFFRNVVHEILNKLE